jgi:hypothetical protein
MTEDTVELLLKTAHSERKGFPVLEMYDLADLLESAALEIERLRARIVRLEGLS